jgi:hypothetical protein
MTDCEGLLAGMVESGHQVKTERLRLEVAKVQQRAEADGALVVASTAQPRRSLARC